jgi:hypothetical protein
LRSKFFQVSTREEHRMDKNIFALALHLKEVRNEIWKSKQD